MWVLLEYHETEDIGTEEVHTSTKIHMIAKTANECIQCLQNLARSRCHYIHNIGDYRGDRYLYERYKKMKFLCLTHESRQYEYFRIEKHSVNEEQ